MPAADGSVLSALTKGALQAAADLGVDAEAVRADAGIDPSWLADPDARVPLASHLRMWTLLSARVDGLELGARLGLDGLGVVGYAMAHGATLGEALDWLHRFRALVHSGVVPIVEERDEPAGRRLVLVHHAPPPFVALVQPVLAFAAGMVGMLRGLTGRPVAARYVALPLPLPADARRVERFFACPVSWRAPAVEVAFDAEVLGWPLARSDERLFGYLARRAEELLAALPAETSMADRARREIGALLAREEPRLPGVAARLAVSERTLHRRLAEEGTGFAALVDAARRERAELLLTDPSLSCSEVAALVGYAEPAAFFRAFKRWNGVSALAWRTQGRARHASDE
ncbi:MAG: AraC family transcriptional regulator [Vicinamibacterales bacterium]